MAQELAGLVDNGTPQDYYHWNRKQAQFLRQQLSQVAPQARMSTWFNYCRESLYAGESQICIDELTNYLAQANRPYPEIINRDNKAVFELLALAWLRLGEQQNCQQHHTAASCIVPLKAAGIHQLKDGSQRAIELYTLLQQTFPNPKYKWLLNVAYMTIGEYPEAMPAELQIKLPHATERQAFPAFEEIAMELGLAQDGLSGGTCIDDFNNDGFLDIFVTSYGMQDNVQLFLSDGNGGFFNATMDAGLEGIVSGLNCLHADYNNDGFKDILVLRGGWLNQAGTHPNSLLKNNGNGTFQDVTHSSGLVSYHPTQTASWADFNNDGHLDLFIGNESTQNDLHPCELFQNNGNGTFTEVAGQRGLGGICRYVKGVTWGDVNNDGWPDLYVSALGAENLLFRNNNGHFTDISADAGVSEPVFSFPCWFWDVNNDGLQDLFVSGYDPRFYEDVAGEYARELQGIALDSETPRLYMNNGDETFSESAEQYGISKSMYAMGANFGDLDNDGYLDFYVGTGAPDFSTIVPNRMFRNVAGTRFEEVTSAGNFGHIQKGHGIAFADLDRDGDQDIYAVMGGAYEGDNFTNILYQNPISNNHWMVIELQGVQTNLSAIGTRLVLELSNGQTLHRTVSTGGSFGASPLHREIGLGSATTIETLTIQWPNGAEQSFKGIEVNQKIVISEGATWVVRVPYEVAAFRKTGGHHH